VCDRTHCHATFLFHIQSQLQWVSKKGLQVGKEITGDSRLILIIAYSTSDITALGSNIRSSTLTRGWLTHWHTGHYSIGVLALTCRCYLRQADKFFTNQRQLHWQFTAVCQDWYKIKS